MHKLSYNGDGLRFCLQRLNISSLPKKIMQKNFI